MPELNWPPEDAEWSFVRVTVYRADFGDPLPVEVHEGQSFDVDWYVRPLPRWRRILRHLSMRNRTR